LGLEDLRSRIRMPEVSGSIFANRCMELPVVNATCFVISDFYNRLKNTNTLTSCSLQLAEQTIKTSINMANPILNKFTNQVQALDVIACEQLNKLEAAFPIILEEPDKIVNHGKEYISQTMIPVVHGKISDIKESTNVTCTAVKNYGINKVEAIRIKNITNRLSNFSDKLAERYIFETVQEDADFKMKMQLVAGLVYTAMQTTCTKNCNLIVQMFDKCLIGLIEGMGVIDNQRIQLKHKLDAGVNTTRYKIDLYRKNLAAIVRQLSVQDGRSIDHVNVCFELTCLQIGHVELRPTESDTPVLNDCRLV
jgi:hypothetical protein